MENTSKFFKSRLTEKQKEQLNTIEKTAKIQTHWMHMAFGPLTSSFSVERDFTVGVIKTGMFSNNFKNLYTYAAVFMRYFGT